MKTISVTVVSSNPTTLSAAAKVLSKFTFTENGASKDVSAYLLRASESFDELARLHRDLESSKSDRKHRKQRPSDVDVGSRGEDGPAAEDHTCAAPSGGEDAESGREKRRKRKRKDTGSVLAPESSKAEQRTDGQKGKSDEVEESEAQNSAKRRSKKRRSKIDGEV